ncbi:MAG: hypothetical protein M0Z54_12015 [Thermaerobacter sp.]|nr:hypothetical protein [Thermaerobacter sp.]
MQHSNEPNHGPRPMSQLQRTLGALRRRWALVAVGVGTAAAVAIGGAVFAASPSSAPSGFWAQLAGKLGISATTLRSDVASVKSSQFQTYAKAHHLTAQQTARGMHRIAHAQWRVVAAHRWWTRAFHPLMLHTTGTTLHMTPGAVRTALKGGTTLSQLATQHGSSPAALQQALQNAVNARLSKLVAAGKMSTARQARIQKAAARMLPHVMNRKF